MAIILRPKHFEALWGRPPLPMELRTLSALLESQRAYIIVHPAMSDQRELTEPIHAYVGNGAWRIMCPCYSATHVDPEWKTAVCFGCGAIHTNVIFPDDYEKYEDLLTKRPIQMTRNWREPETYDDLVAEQLAHGDAV